MSFPNPPRLALIAAVAANGVIGRGGTMPWHLPADLKYFKARTSGKRIIMGRRTWESFSTPLPNREHVVVSSQQLVVPEDVRVVHSLTEAVALPEHGETPVFVIGGNAMYRDALPLADDLYLTEIDADVAGDTYFPAWDRSQFLEVSRECTSARLQPTQPNDAEVNLFWVHYVRV